MARKQTRSNQGRFLPSGQRLIVWLATSRVSHSVVSTVKLSNKRSSPMAAAYCVHNARLKQTNGYKRRGGAENQLLLLGMEDCLEDQSKIDSGYARSIPKLCSNVTNIVGELVGACKCRVSLAIQRGDSKDL